MTGATKIATVPTRKPRRPYIPVEGITMFKGVQLPWTVKWIKGRPDPKQIDAAKVRRCLNEGLCGVCGMRMHRHEGVAFVGGAGGLVVSATVTKYGDPPNHQECAEQAMAECPFLRDKRKRPVQRDQAADDDSGEEPHDTGEYGIVFARWYGWDARSLKCWPVERMLVTTYNSAPPSVGEWQGDFLDGLAADLEANR